MYDCKCTTFVSLFFSLLFLHFKWSFPSLSFVSRWPRFTPLCFTLFFLSLSLQGPKEDIFSVQRKKERALTTNTAVTNFWFCLLLFPIFFKLSHFQGAFCFVFSEISNFVSLNFSVGEVKKERKTLLDPEKEEKKISILCFPFEREIAFQKIVHIVEHASVWIWVTLFSSFIDLTSPFQWMLLPSFHMSIVERKGNWGSRGQKIVPFFYFSTTFDDQEQKNSYETWKFREGKPRQFFCAEGNYEGSESGNSRLLFGINLGHHLHQRKIMSSFSGV